jgi:hypothetical protein
MYKNLIKNLGKFLLIRGLNLLFNSIDKNKDRKISKKELIEFKNFVITTLNKYK